MNEAENVSLHASKPSSKALVGEDADSLIAQSLEFHRNGRIKEALKVVARGMVLYPQNAVLLCHCGAYSAILHRTDVAEAAYLRAIAIRPDYADAHYNLGILYMEQQQHRKAEASYRHAIAIEPTYANAYFNLGVLFKAENRLKDARNAYLKLIELQPDHTDAHVNLGNMLVELKCPHEAQAAYLKAISIQGELAVAHANLGALLLTQKRLPEAETAILRAIALEPNNADVHSHLGNLRMAQQRPGDAEAAYLNAIALKPDFADAHYNLGNLLKDQLRSREAEGAYRQAIHIKPDFSAAHSNLGALLMQQGRLVEAEAAYLRALEIQPDYAEALSNLGNLLKKQCRPEESEAAYLRAIALEPDYAQAHCNLGLLLMEEQRPEESAMAFRHAIAVKPAFADAHSNLGLLLMDQRRAPEAEAAFLCALDAQPRMVSAYSNLGALLTTQRRMQEAEAAYSGALAIDPESADASWNYSLLLLSQGRFSEGWPAYESRYSSLNRVTSVGTRRLVAGDPAWLRQWKGESLENKSLLVWPEQGFGDEIQFVRYLPLLKARGLKQLTLVCKQPLATLFEAQGLADKVVSISVQDWVPDVSKQYDYWCYLLSLPLHFKTTIDSIPVPIPYLFASPERVATWVSRLPEAGYRVGLVWNGNASHSNDASRSIHSLETLAPLWKVSGVTFISLQKGRGEDQAKLPPQDQPLTNLGSEMIDFSDTAAILSQLDLLITVDTATAHLAAAMGVPCWLMLPDYRCDWRWMEDRTDSPWYPGALRLFRQKLDGDWNGVCMEVARALQDHIGSK